MEDAEALMVLHSTRKSSTLRDIHQAMGTTPDCGMGEEEYLLRLVRMP